MKTTRPSPKFFHPAVLATFAVTIACGLSVPSAQANFIVTLQEVGPDVVATGAGDFDLTDLTFVFTAFTVGGRMVPNGGTLATGPILSSFSDGYTGFTGPTNFGSGGLTIADSGSGDLVIMQVVSGGRIFVPTGYVSGSLLADTSTYNNQTFASLGVNPGTYVWSWGSGEHADSFTLQIGPVAAVPESGSTFGLLLLTLATLFGVSRLRSLRSA